MDSFELQHRRLSGLGFGAGIHALSYRFVDPANDVVLPGYSRVDARTSYIFGPSRNEEKMFLVAVNIENLTNRRYYQSGNTLTIIFPGSPINPLTEFQVRF